MKKQVFRCLCLLLVISNSPTADASLWGNLIDRVKEIMHPVTSEIYVFNNTGRVARFEVRNWRPVPEYSWLATGWHKERSAAWIHPGQFSRDISDDPSSPGWHMYFMYEIAWIRGWVWHERRQQWIRKTEWTPFPVATFDYHHDVYMFGFHKIGDDFVIMPF